jgi:hypothetical protein
MTSSILPASRSSPRGDSLLRAVVEALAGSGYEPMERQSTGSTSCVSLRRRAAAAASPARRLRVTHVPGRRCLLLELVPPGPSRAGSVGRSIYWYYQAQRPDDRARIAAGLAASIDSS